MSVQARLQRVIDYIDAHLKDDISIAALADVAGYSPWHLYHLFIAATGTPLMEYVRVRRLCSALDELAQGRRLYDIALDYGFETQAGFYKAFQRHFGCSPKQYRIHLLRGIRYKISPARLSVARGGTDMQDQVIVRIVRDEDADDLWENVYSANTPNEVKDRVARYVQEYAEGKAVPLVAEVDGHAVATAYMSIPVPEAPWGHRCTLFDVVVNPAFQRMGIARRLIEECKTRAVQTGRSMICVEARGGSTAETVYRKLGFIEYGRLPGGFRDTWRTKTPSASDEVLFYIPLTDRA